MDFIDTGAWSKKAIKEAGKYCQVNVAASSSDSNYDHIPDPASWQLSADAKLLHICSNETIGGVQFKHFPESPGRWLPTCRRIFCRAPWMSIDSV